LTTSQRTDGPFATPTLLESASFDPVPRLGVGSSVRDFETPGDVRDDRGTISSGHQVLQPGGHFVSSLKAAMNEVIIALRISDEAFDQILRHERALLSDFRRRSDT
jgi:hypothetical protein